MMYSLSHQDCFYMAPNIDRYTHAYYEPAELNGWLCEYYAYENSYRWRKQSYSPELLNFKEGEDKDIQYFVKAYTKLLDYVIECHSATHLCLIPVPASAMKNSPKYTTEPMSKTGSNRSNRNEIFCGYLAKDHPKLILINNLERVKPKEPKARWSAEQHADTMRCTSGISNLTASDLLVLVDDVTTTGGTMDGAKLLLQADFPKAKIVTLPIGRTRSLADFRPLFS